MRKIFFSQWRRCLWKKVYAGCSYEACNSVVSIWTGNQVIGPVRLLFGPSVLKYNELPKIFVPPPPFLVSKGLLRPYSYWGYSKSFFKPSVSLTEKNLSHVFTTLKIHHQISIKLYLFNNAYQLNRNISICSLGQSRGIWLSFRSVKCRFFISLLTCKSSQLLAHLPVNNNKNVSDYDPTGYKPNSKSIEVNLIYSDFSKLNSKPVNSKRILISTAIAAC